MKFVKLDDDQALPQVTEDAAINFFQISTKDLSSRKWQKLIRVLNETYDLGPSVHTIEKKSIEAFKECLDELEISSNWLTYLYVYGSLESSFLRDFKIEQVKKIKIDEIPIGALILLDNTAIEKINESPYITTKALKRQAFDDTLIRELEPSQKQYVTAPIGTQIFEAATIHEAKADDSSDESNSKTELIKFMQETLEKERQRHKEHEEFLLKNAEDMEKQFNHQLEKMTKQINSFEFKIQKLTNDASNWESQYKQEKETKDEIAKKLEFLTSKLESKEKVKSEPLISFLDDDDDEEIPEPMQQSYNSKAQYMINTVANNFKGPMTIAKFGITSWKRHEISLLEHLAHVHQCLEMVSEAELSINVKLSLILQSLPPDAQWVRDYITPAEKADTDKICTKLVELLAGGSDAMLKNFMKIQRKQNENYLKYYSRLRLMYEFSSNKNKTELESDQITCRILQNKLQEAMPRNVATEFARRLEDDNSNKSLSLTKISQTLMRIVQFCTESIASAEPIENNNSIDMVHEPHKGKPQPKQQHRRNNQKFQPSPKKFDGKCFYCDKYGHRAVDCYSAREHKDTKDGRRGSKQVKCFFCGRNGHIERYCRIKQEENIRNNTQ